MSLTIPPVSANDSAKPVTVSEAVFGQDYNEGLVHQLITTYLIRARSGTKAQKSRSQVKGGGRKPWRQKGTGQARSGTRSSPIWRTGGVTFAAQPKTHSKKLNKKMYRVGMCSILSELLRQQRMVVSDDLSPKLPKTKELLTLLEQRNSAADALIVIDKEDRDLSLASRNLSSITVCNFSNLDPVSLVYSKKIILTPDAVKKIEEQFG